ncbi:MAG TPA: PadR family transcriptional regulator [Candidatus Saccharimonadales bacterium]|nr:PadR family transcriptional regulator [Candidatus Saccharimonadales bacterium]
MSTTRLLLLGALRRIQPAHGYELRQELERWEADKWAAISYGTIYHALTSMQKAGLLKVAPDQPRKGGTSKMSYILTALGQKEYQRLLEESWLTIHPVHDPMLVALNFRSDLSYKSLHAGLKIRVQAAEAAVAHLQERKAVSPLYVAANIDLAIRQQQVFVEWAKNILRDEYAQ